MTEEHNYYNRQLKKKTGFAVYKYYIYVSMYVAVAWIQENYVECWTLEPNELTRQSELSLFSIPTHKKNTRVLDAN